MEKVKFIGLMSILLCLLVVIPVGFAADNETAVDVSDEIQDINASDIADDVLSGEDYYFDASLENDTGNGSADNPYKELTPSRMPSDSNLHFADGEYNLTSDISRARLSFYGQSAQNTILNGNGYTLRSSNLIFNNITLVNLKIVSDGSFDFSASNSVFRDCSNDKGGVISSNYLASVTLTNCTFSNNSAHYGGAIYISSGSIDIYDSTFVNNVAKYGGALYFGSGNANIIGSTFSNNRGRYGGAIFTSKTTVECYDSNFTNNSVAMLGGAVSALSSNLKFDGSSFTCNDAGYEGGAIYSYYATAFTVSDSSFINNSADAGGALFIDYTAETVVTNSMFKANRANNTAGAIYSLSNEDPVFDNITFEDNSAKFDNDLLDTIYPFPFVGDANNIIYVYNSSYTGELPSSYDLRDEGYVTPVKNQGSGGNCWAFAAMAALESCILKASGISYDLSEGNMKNLMALYSDYGWSMTPNVGGYDRMAVGYLTAWLGPINETDDVYDPSSVMSYILNSFVHVQDIVFLTRSNYTDNDIIKKAILDYGAVATSIAWYSKYRDGKNYYCYNPSANEDKVNHAVAIVGWDDNYSRENFKTQPEGDGAWIIKNSWGESGGDRGYYYVSYYDTKLAKPGKMGATYTFVLNDTLKFDKNYQYDLPGRTDSFYNATSTVWYKNIYNATDNEYLAAVSTYFDRDTNWTLSVYVNNALKLVQSGFAKESYSTITLNQFIPLNMGDLFEIVFKITVDGDASFPISERVSLVNSFYWENVSFVSYDGESWTDLYNLTWEYPGHTYNSQVACIKAFTVFNLVNTTMKLTSEIEGGFVVKAEVLNQYSRQVTGGNVTFIVNGEIRQVPLVNGLAVLELFDGPKSYEINASYENVGYLSSNGYICLNTSSINTYIELTVTEHNIVNITARVVNEYGQPINSGNVTFTVDGQEQYVVNVTDGIAVLMKEFHVLGGHSVRAVFNPIHYYNSSNVDERDFTVSMRNTSISLAIDGIHNPVSFTVNVTDQYGNAVSLGNVTFIFDDGTEYVVNVTEGRAALSETFKTFGKRTVTVIFNKKEYYYNSCSVQEEFDVALINTEITMAFDKQYDPVLITVNVTDEYANLPDFGSVTFIVDGAEHVVNVVNGTASLSYTFKNAGVNSVTAVYNGLYVYNSSQITSDITVNPTIISSDATRTYNSQYQFSMLDEYGNPLNNTQITVTVNSKNYKLVTDENGTAVLDIDFSPAKYTIKITNPSSKDVKTQTINVVKRITENKAVTMYYGAGKYYKVKVFDDNGNIAKGVKVKFTIAGKSYTRKTDSSGYASYKITQTVGKYTITAEYKGYKVSNKVTVKTTIVAKNKSVKQGKTIKFQAKLLDKNGKVLKNKKLTFKFKGKTYMVKTNKRGIATLKITKKYKVGKYTITTSYGNLKIKNTIKIKK